MSSISDLRYHAFILTRMSVDSLLMLLIAHASADEEDATPLAGLPTAVPGVLSGVSRSGPGSHCHTLNYPTMLPPPLTL
jgi:hypothetical protein